MRPSISGIIAGAIAISASSVTRGEDARAAFQALYGGKLREVNATADKADDAALAQQLAEAAKIAEANPALLTLMCEQAFQLGLRDPAGHDAAFAAMQTLLQKRPELKLESLQRIVQLRQHQYNLSRGSERTAAGEALIAALTQLADAKSARSDAAGSLEDLRKALVVARQVNSKEADALAQRVHSAAQLAQLNRQIESLKTKLLRDRTDSAAAEELAGIYVRELNQPAKAAEYLPLLRDAEWRRNIDLSRKASADLTEAELLPLARWYRDHASQASASAKPALLTRAAGYYRQYLSMHTAQDLERTQAALALKQIEDDLEATAPSPSTGSVSAARPDGLLTVGAKPRAVLFEDSQMIYGLAIDPTGRYAATVSQPDGSLRIFDLEKSAPLAVLSDEKKWLTAAAFAPKGDIVAASDLHNEAHLWNLKTGKKVTTLRKHTDGVWAVAIDPETMELATAGKDRVIHLWNAADGAWQKSLTGHTDSILALAYAPRSAEKRLLASGGEDTIVRLWSPGGDQPVTLKGHTGPIHCLAFSPDGRTLASGDRGGLIIIWDLQKREPKHRLSQGSIGRSLAFSPDGTALFTGGGKNITVWHSASGEKLAELSGHSQIVSGIGFTADGKTMVSSGQDRSLRTWDVIRQRTATPQQSQK